MPATMPRILVQLVPLLMQVAFELEPLFKHVAQVLDAQVGTARHSGDSISQAISTPG